MNPDRPRVVIAGGGVAAVEALEAGLTAEFGAPSAEMVA
jgi:hypothetical protein